MIELNPEVLIINGSPRKNKNCFNMINEITKELIDSKISYKVFDIYDMNIEYCTACGFCEKTGYCKFKDDMTPMYDMFDKAKGTIVVSPVHFDCISAKVKTVVDRTQAIYASKYILNKPSIDRNKKRIGMYIAVGGSSPYQSQFKGGQIVMDFFFKSINTKLTYNYYLNNSDKVAFIENNQAIKDLKKYITNYIKDIKELG
ncbi:flavodoxin-related protein [[Clostridium] sordellii]|uniref:Flavodoxin-related protein n=1 Tax=Paraclostridium sordellii TaxID=1505 RepID=A0ABM9RS43_PARSO|nr:NAD(P)H-dependent oxidoreductase [Paeniclostridium sordellii]CEJ74885.1 putative flavodoxin-related protein [[Clostridium] sordellii] [Paeniclostridium sordellii]CEN70458.1 flavodoxin-related protein [[Clostridium] sordellii] [Paeniclostridium sordellii]CEN73748.1 flavodoxin-related protein [[Clostridium] sordellii] [Paeniclostridium sordellii]CEO27334.1 flavodoxin-related protein [[Clostridium] sordellii] [Paeniclostridium sordellii]CEP65274.1 flavodoxin-related protein [[Clostridium] sord